MQTGLACSTKEKDNRRRTFEQSCDTCSRAAIPSRSQIKDRVRPPSEIGKHAGVVCGANMKRLRNDQESKVLDLDIEGRKHIPLISPAAVCGAAPAVRERQLDV